jgi:hypothetical protein
MYTECRMGHYATQSSPVMDHDEQQTVDLIAKSADRFYAAPLRGIKQHHLSGQLSWYVSCILEVPDLILIVRLG